MSESTEPATEQVEATIPVTVHIDPDTFLRQLQGRYYDEGPPTLAEALTERIVDAAVDRIVGQVLDKALGKTILDQVSARVDEVISARLEEPIQAVTEWGTRIGEPVTLREQIGKAVEAWPKQSSSHRSEPNLQKWIKEAVDRAVREDLSGALKEARNRVAERLQAEAARLLAEQATPGGGR
jgi:hypothetical protein